MSLERQGIKDPQGLLEVQGLFGNTPRTETNSFLSGSKYHGRCPPIQIYLSKIERGERGVDAARKEGIFTTLIGKCKLHEEHSSI